MEPSVLSAIQHPLTALVTSVQLLEEDLATLPAEQIRDRIAALHRGAFWLHELVENVLCAASIRDGRLYIHRRPLHVEDVVEEISSVVTPILSQQGQRLDTFAGGRTPEVHADPRRLGQVVVNLISNASEHSSEGSPLAIGIDTVSDAVRVSVADRGPYLPDVTDGELLENFWRPVRVHQPPYETTGLGLAVARWIIETHGGRVGARNRRGGGARFWFELPTTA